MFADLTFEGKLTLFLLLFFCGVARFTKEYNDSKEESAKLGKDTTHFDFIVFIGRVNVSIVIGCITFLFMYALDYMDDMLEVRMAMAATSSFLGVEFFVKVVEKRLK